MKTRIAPREIRYGGAVLDDREIDAVVQTMRSGMAIGEAVRTFEDRCAQLMGKKYGVMVNSGSSALMMAIRMLQLPPRSEIITPVLTFSTDVAAIIHAGHVPVFVDVECDTYQIDTAKIEGLIGPETRAMLVPNLIGGSPDWDALRAIADRHGLKIVEDSCDTLGVTLHGEKTGKRSDISVTSFSIFHIITCLGNGGLIAVDDEDLWDWGLMARCWGRSSEKYLHGTRRQECDGRFLEDLDGVAYDGMFIFEDIAYGFIPNEAGAAFGHEQLNKFDTFWRLRAENFASHCEFLSKYPNLFIPPRVLPGVDTTWLCCPLQLRPDVQLDRRALQVHLEDAGIATRVIFSGNITRHPMMKKVHYRADGNGYPVADQIMERGILLPCHPTMTKEDNEYLYQTIEDFLHSNINFSHAKIRCC